MSWLRVVLADVGGRGLAMTAAVVIAVAVLIDPGDVTSPLGGLLVPWLFLSCLTPLALVGVVPGPLAVHERVSMRGPGLPTAVRVGFGLAVVGVATAAIAVLAPADADPSGAGMVAWRNAALVTGLTLGGAAWLAVTTAWVPGTAYVLVLAAFGSPPGEPYAWSTLTAPAEDGRAALIGVVVLALGLALVVLRVRRPRRVGGRRARAGHVAAAVRGPGASRRG